MPAKRNGVTDRMGYVMSKLSLAAADPMLEVFTKPSIIRGRQTTIECVKVGGQTYTLKKGLATIMSLEDEWFEDVADPEAVVESLKSSTGFKPDVFTFWQRVPDVEPKYPFPIEWEEIAVLPVTSYDHWWNNQIKSRVRNQIRKARKEGLAVRDAAYDDEFVRGMTEIFNETPVRQGRKFWHYGKDFQTVKREFSRYLHREDMAGAYYKDEMIGFIMLSDAGRFGLMGQIISAISHRDKFTNYALMAKAVELCERKKLPYLAYLYWSDGSLSEFKRRCGFECVRVPRYFVPLTAKGKMILRFGLHRGWREIIPKQLKDPLKKLRSNWYAMGRS